MIYSLDCFAYKLGAFMNLIASMIWDALASYFINLFTDNIVTKIQYTNLTMGAWIIFHDDKLLPPEARAQIIFSGYFFMLLPFIWIYWEVI
jgi:hypothetical protein